MATRLMRLGPIRSQVSVVTEPDGSGGKLYVAVMHARFLTGSGSTERAALNDLRLVVEQTTAANRANGRHPFHGLPRNGGRDALRTAAKV